MFSLLGDSSILDNYDSIAVYNCGESMSYDDYGPVLLSQQTINSFLNIEFTLCIQSGGGFVEDEYFGIFDDTTGCISKIPYRLLFFASVLPIA